MATEPKANTVCVACKLPHGLELQLYKPVPLVAAGALVPAPEPIGDPIVIAGANAENAVGGYGFTYGVDASRFGDWMRANENFPAVRRGLIFSESNPDRARDRAREQANIVSGFEGINAQNPPDVLPDKYEGMPKAATKAT
jgi:hypothetical protein